MSNIEHLIENALTAIDTKHDYGWWLVQMPQQQMLKEVKSKAEEIWEMATYVYYTYRPSVIMETKDKMESKYGYPIPE